MHMTVFDTPVVSHLMYAASWAFLRLTGWRTHNPPPDIPKYVIAGAPHTSNWDFVYAIAFAFVFKIKIYWMGKSSLFRFPFGPYFRWMGGIPIDRSKSHGVVAQTVENIRAAERLVLVVAPEGTRKSVPKWKTGFYHVARGANVPIVLAFLDYKKRIGGFGPVVTPTGDIEADMKEIRSFFATVKGRHPSQFNKEINPTNNN